MINSTTAAFLLRMAKRYDLKVESYFVRKEGRRYKINIFRGEAQDFGKLTEDPDIRLRGYIPCKDYNMALCQQRRHGVDINCEK